MKLGSYVEWALVPISIFWGWHYLLDGEQSMCRARAKYVAEQAPYAIDILAARHPLSVGLLRAFLNKDGELDRFIHDVIMSGKNDDKEDVCALQTALMHFSPDKIRLAMADDIEKGLDIKDYP